MKFAVSGRMGIGNGCLDGGASLGTGIHLGSGTLGNPILVRAFHEIHGSSGFVG